MDLRTSKRGKEMLCAEIEKIVSEGNLSRERLELLHKLTDTLKNFYKIEMAEEYSDNGSSHRGYSHDHMDHIERRYAHDHAYDGNYDEGHSERRRHLVRSHYSYDDGREEMIGKFDELMREAPTDRDREAIRKCISIMRDA